MEKQIGDLVDAMLSHVPNLQTEKEIDAMEGVMDFPEGFDQWENDANIFASVKIKVYRTLITEAHCMFSNYFSNYDMDEVLDWCEYLNISIDVEKDDHVSVLKKIAKYFHFKPGTISGNLEELRDQYKYVKMFYEILITMMEYEND